MSIHRDADSIVPQMQPLLILGGTFDPIHHGHLCLARAAAELFPGAEVVLMPCGVPAHRPAPSASAQQRLKMVEIALMGQIQLGIFDLETNQSAASYSVETLTELRRRWPRRSVSLLMGSDALVNLHHWHQALKLASLCHLLVVSRSGLDTAPGLRSDLGFVPISPKTLRHQACGGQCPLALPRLDISATRLRERVHLGQSIRWLVPGAVVDYIEQQGLYQ